MIVRFALLAALTVLAFAEPFDTRQSVWAMQFARLLKEPPEWRGVEHHTTGTPAFSPDDKRIAVTYQHGYNHMFSCGN